jgi:hypothetical protein
MIGRLFLTLPWAISAAAQQESAVASFSTQTRLVLLSFHMYPRVVEHAWVYGKHHRRRDRRRYLGSSTTDEIRF